MEKAVRRSLPREQRVCPVASGYIVTVTSKNTGKSVVRYCKTDLDAEEFIDYACFVVDENGEAWWSMQEANLLSVFDSKNYK